MEEFIGLCWSRRGGEQPARQARPLHSPRRKLGAPSTAAAAAAVAAPAALQVLLPLREVSWDWIPNTAGVLTPGQEIKCIVTNLQGPPKTKVRLWRG